MDVDGTGAEVDLDGGSKEEEEEEEDKLYYVSTHFGASLTDVFLAVLPLYHATPGVDDTNRPPYCPSLQNTWQANLSAILINLLNLAHMPLHLTGRSLEAFLNFVHRHLFSSLDGTLGHSPERLSLILSCHHHHHHRFPCLFEILIS